MKKLILYAVLIIVSALTACDDMFNDAFSDVAPKTKYYGYVTTTSSLYSYEVLEDGSFQQIGAPVTGLNASQRIAVHPSGDYIYVAATGSILCYKTEDDGALTALAPLVNGAVAYQNLVVHPSGKYLYAISSASSVNCVYIYNINPDGSLVYNSITTDVSGISQGIAINPSGTRVFVAKDISNQIRSYGVGNTGILNDMKTITSTDVPGNLVVHSSGNYLYCASGNSALSMNILSDGSLTQINNLIATSTSDIALHPSNKYIYTTYNDISFYNFGVLNTGGLIGVSPGITISGSQHNYIGIHPNGKYVYIADKSTNSSLISYTADAAGSLSFNTMTAKTSLPPIDIKIVSKTVYGANN